MKLMLTCFIIPYGFVYHPELMSFPNISLSVIPPILLLLALQVTTAVLCYGYLFRDLTRIERGAFALATAVGFAALVGAGTVVLILFIALTAGASFWMFATKERRVAMGARP